MPDVTRFEKFESLPEVERNTLINRHSAGATNAAAKRTLGDDERTFKDSRAIWARCVYELHFKKDEKWQKKDEDVFFREMLGHQDTETQQAYKQFKLDMTELKESDADDPTDRLSEITKLDNQEAIKSKAMQKIHSYVKDKLKADPFAKITQSLITKELGSGRPVIKRYLQISVADTSMEEFLKVQPAPAPIIKKEITVMEADVEPVDSEAPDDDLMPEDFGDHIDEVEEHEELDEESDEDEQLEIETSKQEKSTTNLKPRIKASHVEDDFIHVIILLGDEVIVDFKAKGSQMDVIKAAWIVYESLISN